MGWPDWLSSRIWDTRSDTPAKRSTSNESLTDTLVNTVRSSNESTSNTPAPADLDPRSWLSLQILLPTLLLTATSLAGVSIYKSHLRRIPNASHVKPNFFRKRSLYGYVTSVGDGDNFRLYHTPGGRLAGWGWLPGRRKHIAYFKQHHRPSNAGGAGSGAKGAGKVAASEKVDLKDATVHVRLAGVDAPELAHFGRPAQPFGEEALVCLKELVLGRHVRCYLFRPDQYGRVVAGVYTSRWLGLGSRDVGLEMLKRGMATVYEAKFGSEFGNKEDVYRREEAKAKESGMGMWKGEKGTSTSWWSTWLGGAGKKGEKLETPRQYKDRMHAAERGEAEGKIK